ncbi:MAG: transposase [Clostridiales bacterium]|nr:transposase [Candidatus Scatonaster coprocaballi]
MFLAIRKWICPCCHQEHGRDKNAAINILKKGMLMTAIG